MSRDPGSGPGLTSRLDPPNRAPKSVRPDLKSPSLSRITSNTSSLAAWRTGDTSEDKDTSLDREPGHPHCTSLSVSVCVCVYLDLVGVSRDAQRLISSSGQGSVLDHHHLHTCSLLKGDTGVTSATGVSPHPPVQPANHLQLFDGVSAPPDHQPNLTGRNQHLLY